MFNRGDELGRTFSESRFYLRCTRIRFSSNSNVTIKVWGCTSGHIDLDKY